jgi:hypothetical protein
MTEETKKSEPNADQAFTGRDTANELMQSGPQQNDQPKTPVHGPEDFKVSAGADAIPQDERVGVTKEDLMPPKEFEKGAALINLVVNVKDIRNPDDGEIGALYPEQAAEFTDRAEVFMDRVYRDIPEDERQGVDVVILAGETDLVTPGPQGIKNPHQRALETGDLAIEGIKKSMLKFDIDQEAALTTQHDRPIATNQLNDIGLLHPFEPHPDGVSGDDVYLEYLINKYGTGRELWMVFEDDTEKDMRERLGAEGPTEIADRTNYLINICSTIAKIHQQDDPDKRVVVFAFGHYDNFSPWVKKHLMGIDPAEGFVPMEKGSGIVIKKSPDNTATTNIGDRTFPVNLESVI